MEIKLLLAVRTKLYWLKSIYLFKAVFNSSGQQTVKYTFKKNNKQTKKPINCFLHDDARAGILSLQTSIGMKLCQNPSNGL